MKDPSIQIVIFTYTFERVFHVLRYQGTATETSLRFYLIPVGTAIIKRTKASKDTGNQQPLFTGRGTLNLCGHNGNKYGGFSKN